MGICKLQVHLSLKTFPTEVCKLIPIHLAGKEDVRYQEVQNVVVQVKSTCTLKVEVIYPIKHESGGNIPYKTLLPTYHSVLCLVKDI
jgi:hypothetical protein